MYLQSLHKSLENAYDTMLNEEQGKIIFNRIINFKNHKHIEEQKTSKIESLNSETQINCFLLVFFSKLPLMNIHNV